MGGCCSRISSFFEPNAEGKSKADEVMETVDKVLDILIKIVGALEGFNSLNTLKADDENKSEDVPNESSCIDKSHIMYIFASIKKIVEQNDGHIALPKVGMPDKSDDIVTCLDKAAEICEQLKKAGFPNDELEECHEQIKIAKNKICTDDIVEIPLQPLFGNCF